MLQWTHKDHTLVALAVESGIDEVIINNLKEIEPFNDESKWKFTSATHTDMLPTLAKPDVLLVSRFLPGERPHDLLKEIKQVFPGIHIVFLVGERNEQCRQYIRAARELGFENFVSGNLPGELPYTLDLALQYSYSQVMRGTGTFNKPGSSAVEPQRGILVASAGAKGGIGKTTITAGVTQALALQGLRVTAADVDFSRQDLTAFFKVTSMQGFDWLAGICHEDVIRNVVPVNRSINVLPGSGNKTPACWPEPEDMITILNSIRETAPVVIVDTPSDLNCPHTPTVLQEADMVLVVIDQSRFTDQDIFDYGAFLLENGITPDKVKLIVNRYSKKLMPVSELVRAFNQGIRGQVQVSAYIPYQWEKYAKASHKGEIPGVRMPKSPWQKLAREVSREAGISQLFPERLSGFSLNLKKQRGY